MTRILAFLILFLFNVLIYAQNTSASPYSASGLGERSFSGTQASRHMGGLDVFTDSIHANLNNPAGYGFLKATTYSIGINYTNINLASLSESRNSDIASIDYIAVSIPAGKFSFGFGLLPFTSVGYRVEGNDDTSELQIFNRYEGNGGLNQAYFSLGLPLTSYFAIGSTLNYNFGNLFYRTGQFIEGIDNGTFLSNESSVSGFSFQFSAQAKIPIQKKYTFQAMYSFQPIGRLDSRNSRVFSTQSLSTEILTDFVQNILGNLFIALLIITLLGMYFSAELAYVFAPGFADDNTKLNLTSEMLFVTFPYLLFISLTAMCAGIFNSYNRFILSGIRSLFSDRLAYVVASARKEWIPQGGAILCRFLPNYEIP